ncbi:MAG: bile acid:sodium symporter family protein [Planctomycetota bacterium]
MLDRFLAGFRTQLERFLLVWLTLVGLAAYFWEPCFPDLPDPFRSTAGYLNYLFAVTMFAIGSILPRDEIEQVLRRWPTVLGGTAIQYLTMPLLAYGFGRLFGLSDELMIGVVMVGCVPGAMASNVLTLVARGTVSYSLSLTTSATLLSPVVVPLVLWLALGQWVSFPVGEVSWKLCWMVVLPVVAGHLLSRRFAGWFALARGLGPIIANLTILWIIAVVVAGNREKLLQLDARLPVALLLVNLGGYAAGLLGGFAMRLSDPMRRALTLEIGMQNAGLGTVLAVELFGRSSASSIPPALYTFGCMFTGIIVARLWVELGRRAELDRR